MMALHLTWLCNRGLEELGNNLFHAVFVARLPLSRRFFNEIVAYQELACVIVTLLACLCSHARRREKRENQKQKLGISRALACAPFEAPWVRKFGYLCIQEILVLTKSSVRTSSCVLPAGVKFRAKRTGTQDIFSLKRVGRKFHVVVVENKETCKKGLCTTGSPSSKYEHRWALYIKVYIERKPFTKKPIKRPKIGPRTTQERRNTHFK